MAKDPKREKLLSMDTLGNDKFRAGEYCEAIQCFENCVEIAKETNDMRRVGKYYTNTGLVYETIKNFHKAIECNQKSLSIALELRDRNAETLAYGNLGRCLLNAGKYDEAIKYYELILNLSKEMDDKDQEEEAYLDIGIALQELSKNNEAIEYYENGLSIAQQIGKREVMMWENLGHAYESTGNYKKAAEYHNKCLSVAKEWDDRQLEGLAYGHLGGVYHLLGNNHKAIECYNKSLDIVSEVKDTERKGILYGKLGNSYQSLGNYKKAMEEHKKCLNIAISESNMAEQAVAYSGIGSDFLLMGKYDLAMDYHKRSLKISEQISNKEYEQAAYGNLGNTFKALGRLDDAIKCHQKDLDISLQIGNKEGEGAANSNLGMVHMALGKSTKAVVYFKKSLDIALKIGDTFGEGTAYVNLGKAYHSLGILHKAIDYHEKSLNIAIEIGDRKGEGVAYLNLGCVYQTLRKNIKAIEYHARHINITQEIGDKKGEGVGHFHFGLCYLRKHNLEREGSELHCSCMVEAERQFLKCIACHESLFDDLTQDQDRISIVDTYDKAYKFLAFIYFDSQLVDQALLACDRGRARALGELLNLKYEIDKGTTDKIAPTIVDVKQLLTTSKFCILFYALHPVDPNVSSLVLTYKHATFHVNSDIKDLESSAECFTDKSDELNDKLLTNLLENAYDYMNVRKVLVNCEDRSVSLLNDSEADCISKDAVNQENAEKPLQNPKLRNVYDVDEDDKPLQLLYHKLVSPIAQNIFQDEVVVIPDGPLFMVPFAALQDPKTGKYLSETKCVRMASSLTTLKLLQESAKDQHYESGALIVGNPKVGKVIFRGLERSITDLPGAEDEAKKVGKILGVKPLIGQRATKELVMQKLQIGVSVIHFAAHGSENGQILLAPSVPSPRDTTPEEEDYVLTMKEAQEIGIRAQLVVLSCCHSGRGKIMSEGVVGMSRAFLAAGAQSVVASLWAIDDEATKVFMLKFYSHLKKGETSSKSLQQAMKEVREMDEYKQPKYWAGFFLIGDDVKIDFSQMN